MVYRTSQTLFYFKSIVHQMRADQRTVPGSLVSARWWRFLYKEWCTLNHEKNLTLNCRERIGGHGRRHIDRLKPRTIRVSSTVSNSVERNQCEWVGQKSYVIIIKSLLANWSAERDGLWFFTFHVSGVAVTDCCVFGISVGGKLVILDFVEVSEFIFEKRHLIECVNVWKPRRCINCKKRNVFKFGFEGVI